MPDLITETRKPKLKDIADCLGVSICTVSRVLNGKTTISSEVSEKIKQVAQEMGYVLHKSPAKDKPKGAELGVIGYLFNVNDDRGIETDSFYQNFLNGVQQAGGHYGSHVICAPCGKEAREDKIPTLVSSGMVKGIILLATSDISDAWIQKINARVPVVLLNENRIEREVPSVTCDNFNAVFQVVRYLRELNHQRIGFLSVDDLGWTPVGDHEERLEAFLKYAPLPGVEMDPRLIQKPTRDRSKEDLAEVISRALKNFLAMGPNRPTAIICATDCYAVELIRVAGSCGISIPDDISVICLRDTVICEFSTPPLTSISMQEFELGRKAAELLQQRIENPNSPTCHVTVATQLIKRLSCKMIQA